MEYQYEPIKHQIDIPIKIFTQTVEQFPYHWHEDMEILFILNGVLEIRVDQKVYTLKEGDIFLVNNNEIHFIKSLTEFGKTQLLALQFTGDYFNKYQMDLTEKKFRLDSSEGDERFEAVYDEIRFILASMMNLVINQADLYYLHIEKHMIELLVILLHHFELKESDVSKKSETDERLLDILKFINQHCTDSQMNIQVISEHFYLNPQYLSRYFKTQVGVSIKKFIENMRLNKSLKALRLSEERILDLALKFGFPDAKAYYRVFKELLNTTPMLYREQHKVIMEKQQVKDYFSINSKDTLQRLFKYLNKTISPKLMIHVDETIKIPMKQTLDKFDHTYQNLMTFGYGPHGLRKDFYDQLQAIQNDIGFNYVRFHGIFADEFLVYNVKSDGSVYYNFNHIDVLLDQLLMCHVKPFIELGFMPKGMASRDDTIFWWHSNISPPKSISAWVDLLEHFFKHIINRYGKETIRTWYFEFWNEPDVEQFFWTGTRHDFFEFYKASYMTIKNIDPHIKLGGFGNIIFLDVWTWLTEFDEYAVSNHIKLDFFSFHVYNLKSSQMFESINSFPTLLVDYNDNEKILKMAQMYDFTLGDTTYITSCIDELTEKNKQLKSTSNECWITEWNANTDSRDLIHDTCYMAAFIVHNVIQNHRKVSGMGFWTFTDLFEEMQLEQPIFHGGFGLMTYNGLKKAGYNAYVFLSQLGDELVFESDKMVVTKKGDDYQMLFYHYCQPNNLYRKLDYSQITKTDRYSVFDDQKTITLHLTLEHLLGKYQITTRHINRATGSVFDAWVDIGAPEQLDDAGYQYLESRSKPGYFTETVCLNGADQLEVTLEPHEVKLITLKKIY